MHGSLGGHAVRWREWIETDADVLARFADGTPAAIEAGRRIYLACWPDATLLDAALRHVLAACGADIVALPPGVRLRRRGALRFAFNYGPEPWTLGEQQGRRFVLGGATIAPQDFACWREA